MTGVTSSHGGKEWVLPEANSQFATENQSLENEIPLGGPGFPELYVSFRKCRVFQGNLEIGMKSILPGSFA